VYQVGNAGTLPTGPAAQLANVPITILPGFPNTTASTSKSFPFGIWFANATTLYVCDEGDGTLVTPAVNGNVADAQSLAAAGLEMAACEWHVDPPVHSASWIEPWRALQRGKLTCVIESGNRWMPQHHWPPQ
jgi:hypothetical protein